MYNVRTPNAHIFRRSGISTSPSLLRSLHWYWIWLHSVKQRKCWEETGWVRGSVCLSAAALWLLHDADTAVELTLGVVVVDVGIGVAAAHVGRGHGRQAARIVGATVLK